MKRNTHIIWFEWLNFFSKNKACFIAGIIVLATGFFSREVSAQPPAVFTLTPGQPTLEIKQGMVSWYVDKANSISLDNVSDKLFYPFPAKDFLTVQAGWGFFSKF